MLGRNTEDIDIALDDMKGEEMAKLINDELYQGHEKYGIVKENPDKSKHLQTATIKINKQFVDFVNLRSETYTEHSRVPQIEIGTPEEDALRRDITINSMFYNIMTNSIEDWLGKGINDLENGIIRTPLCPRITFLDDPLRILRVIRFAVRYQFIIDEAIERAILTGKDIKETLGHKISNERIAKELLQMLGGNKPNCAIYLLFKYNILDACLKVDQATQSDLLNSVNLCIILGHVIENYKNNLRDKEDKKGKQLNNKENKTMKDAKDIKREDEDNNNKDKNIHIIYLTLITLPLKQYPIKLGKETLNGSIYAIRESLKLKNEYVKDTNIILENYEKLNKIVSSDYNRLTIGQFIRQVKSTNLEILKITSICTEYYNHCNQTELLETIDTSLLNIIVEKHTKWELYLQQENLQEIDSMKPLMDGISIQKEFQLEKGKIIGELLIALINKQIEQPDMTIDGAKLFLYNKIKNEKQ
jgi:tRNA nucleotidyltransferase (CCA-adding enzyme)